LPEGVGWRGIVGAAAVAGIGFTVALFVAELAFADPGTADRARVGILLASVVSGAIGFGVLRRVRA
jgi:NhaA family Na+:H+ antiporter